MATQNTKPVTTELQDAAEQLRIANLRIADLLHIAEQKAEDELSTVIDAMHRYTDDAFTAYQRIEKIANAQAQKGGAR